MNIIPVIIVLFYLSRIYARRGLVLEDNSCRCFIHRDLFENLNNYPLFVRRFPEEVLYYKFNNKNMRMHVEVNETIEFHCPKSEVVINSSNQKRIKGMVEGTCLWGAVFQILNEPVNISRIYCENYFNSTLKRTELECPPKGKIYLVGYELDDSRFFTQYTSCYDIEHLTAYSTFYRLSRSPVYWKNIHFPIFESGRLNIKRVFSPAQQRKAFNAILRLHRHNQFYIKPGIFLGVLRLIPEKIFLHSYDKRATSWYVNTVPSWTTNNFKHWDNLDHFFRAYSKVKKTDIDVYTGTYGVMTIKDRKNIDREVYIINDTAKIAPVPLLHWKVAYEPLSESGIAFIRINNPFILETDKSSIVCTDISTDLLIWKALIDFVDNNYVDGFMYACRMSEFYERVPYFPKLKDNGLLFTDLVEDKYILIEKA